MYICVYIYIILYIYIYIYVYTNYNFIVYIYIYSRSRGHLPPYPPPPRMPMITVELQTVCTRSYGKILITRTLVKEEETTTTRWFICEHRRESTTMLVSETKATEMEAHCIMKTTPMLNRDEEVPAQPRVGQPARHDIWRAEHLTPPIQFAKKTTEGCRNVQSNLTSKLCQ